MAWNTPKVDWDEKVGIKGTDLNRIEGNILDLHGRLSSLTSDVTDHEADTDIHATKAAVRTDSGKLKLELTTTDTGHTSGDIWIRTDL